MKKTSKVKLWKTRLNSTSTNLMYLAQPSSIWILTIFLGLSNHPTSVYAKSKWKSKGQVTLESRIFSDDNNPLTVDRGLGMLGRVELSHRHRPFKEKARVYGRLDALDFNRTIYLVEELWAEVKWGDLDIRIGADLLNWTATEAFHPADIINARNLDSDFESYEKLGEPMIALSYDIGVGSLSLYFFPYYTESLLPAQSSRLSFIPPEVPVGSMLRMDAHGHLNDTEFGPQGALRFTQSFQGIDLGLHIVHHMDRSQPEVLIDIEQQVGRPLFRTVTQIGGTYQQVIDAVILKVEAGYRTFARPENNITPFGPVQERDHLQVAVGIEYGWLIDNTVDLVLIAECQSYFLVDKEIRQSLGVFQRDALLGSRISLNDINNTELLFTGIIDLEDPEQLLINATVSRRFLSAWSLSAAFRMVFGEAANINQGFQVPPASDHARLFLTRYF